MSLKAVCNRLVADDHKAEAKGFSEIKYYNWVQSNYVIPDTMF